MSIGSGRDFLPNNFLSELWAWAFNDKQMINLQKGLKNNLGKCLVFHYLSFEKGTRASLSLIVFPWLRHHQLPWRPLQKEASFHADQFHGLVEFMLNSWA